MVTIDDYAMPGFRQHLRRIKFSALQYGLHPEEDFLSIGYKSLATLHRFHDPLDLSLLPPSPACDALSAVKVLLAELDHSYSSLTPRRQFEAPAEISELVNRIQIAAEPFTQAVRESRYSRSSAVIVETSSEICDTRVLE